MSIPVSTVPAARQYLVTAIGAAIDDTTTEVFDGEPTQPDRTNWIVIGGVRRAVSPLSLVGDGGQFWRDERYHVDITINCFIAGRDASMQQADTNAYALLGTVETVVRQDPSLGGLVLQANPESSTSRPLWDENGMGAECEITTSIEVYTTL